MGNGRWTAKNWDQFSNQNIANKTTTTGSTGIYRSNQLHNSLNPHGVDRESRDSLDNPESTAIIVGLDVTGSMSHVLDSMARKGLPTLATEIYKRKPVTDPHIMMAGIGDAFCDRSPLQVTQFEADIRIAEQLTNLYLEGGGGGNREEGYALLWYFADKHTQIDCMEKRNKKGYLFTVGNDGPTTHIAPHHFRNIFGDNVEVAMTSEELLARVSRSYEVFHLHLTEGFNSAYTSDKVYGQWQNLLGERAISLSDSSKMGEVIVSLLEVLGGKDKKQVIQSWDGETSLVVSQAVKSLSTNTAGGGLVEF